jgi:DNA helicase-2/ATP-dependent DNA helicase PcrA
MTRAKNDLHLIAPLKYYVASQARLGDRHVNGAKSRFMSNAVMLRLDSITWPQQQQTEMSSPPQRSQIDITSKLRRMWS